MEKKKTYFVDIDGTIFVYRKFETYRESKAEVIKSTKQYLQQAKDEGHMIILTTARPEEMRDHTIHELYFNNVPYDRLIMGIGGGARVLINDLKPDRKGDTAIAINLKRDIGVKDVEI